jgi:hypothetical protein
MKKRKAAWYAAAVYHASQEAANDTDAQAYFDAVSLTDTAYTAPINTFVLALKAASIWTKFDRLWLMANKDATAALTCIKSLSAATPQNAPTFAAGQGYTFNGSTQYIDSGWSPDDGPSFALNSASYGCFVRTSSASGVEIPIGTADNASNICQLLFGFPDANSFYATVNSVDALTITAAHSGRTGLWQMNRSAAGAAEGYKNGASVDTGTTAAGLVATSNFFVGAFNSGGAINFFTGQISAAFAGNSFDATQAAAFDTAFDTLKASIGF